MTTVKSELSEDDSSDSESEWEEVEELLTTQDSPMKSQVPKEAVEITVDLPGVLRMKRKRKKQEFDMIAYFQRQLNRYNKEQRIEMHKAHLVCLLASGFHSNSLCNNATLQALALSIIPTEYLKKTLRQYDAALLLRIVKWFKSVFDIDGEVQEEKNAKLDDTLVKRFDERKVASEKELVYIFVILLRVLQLDCRLVISLQPMPYKTTVTQGKGPAKRQMSKKKKTVDSGGEISPTSKPKKTNNKKNVSKDKASTTKKKAEDEPCTSKQSQMAAENETPVMKRTLRAKNDRKRTCALKATPIIDVDSEDEFLSDEDEYIASSPTSSDVSEDEESIQTRTPKQKTPKQKVLTTKRSKSKGQSSQARKKQSLNIDEVEVLSDSDFEDDVIVMATGPRKSAEKKSKKHSKKMISSDSDQSVEILKTKNVKEFKKGCDYWVEVYLATDEKWVCVDCVRSSVNHPELCEKMATQPVSYVLAFSNDNCVKDVTCRYASKWMSHTRKQRVDQEWWEETLSPYQPRDTEKNENEDLALQAKLQQQPLPTSIGEFKNHPLYALTRHLLKFEAFYPEKSAILGYCRGEPVFSRQCVHTLHTRETWLKEGRVVRIGEEPYKMVKARPKPNRNYKDMESKAEPKVAVYGRWQTEEYIPPPAVDGKVPRNEHGNVELFLPTMLPKGTVHLQIPGLNRVARKLDIDCAPAMVGWDFHGGFSHPLYDGFVVCEEFQETLVDAWQQDQQEMERKAREKREKRVYKNWKLLIKGLLIKERLKKRFATEDSSPTTVNTDSGDVSMDMKMSWPTNKQTKKRKRKEATSSKDLFPFEKL
ncbi:DNA repair protein complementing XP-C cells-like [Glandiceps talaboti]